MVPLLLVRKHAFIFTVYVTSLLYITLVIDLRQWSCFGIILIARDCLFFVVLFCDYVLLCWYITHFVCGSYTISSEQCYKFLLSFYTLYKLKLNCLIVFPCVSYQMVSVFTIFVQCRLYLIYTFHVLKWPFDQRMKVAFVFLISFLWLYSSESSSFFFCLIYSALFIEIVNSSFHWNS